MGETHFKALQEKGASLCPLTAKLSMYTGKVIPVLGISDVKVEHNGQTAVLPLVVIPGTGPPLLGREWLTTLQLDWQKILQVRRQCSLQELLDAYSEVFSKTLLGRLRVYLQSSILRVPPYPDSTRPDQYLSHYEKRWRKSSNASSSGE